MAQTYWYANDKKIERQKIIQAPYLCKQEIIFCNNGKQQHNFCK